MKDSTVIIIHVASRDGELYGQIEVGVGDLATSAGKRLLAQDVIDACPANVKAELVEKDGYTHS